MNSLHVICKIGQSEFAIPATDIVQIESYSHITPVPGTPSYVDGLVQVRQHVIPIINSRARFGFSPAEPTADSRFVIVKLGTRRVGLLVDSAREIRHFNPEDFSASADLLSGQSHGFLKSVAQMNDRIIMLIDSFKFVGQET